MTNKNKEIVEKIEEQIIEQIAQNMKLYGMSLTLGRLMATIHYKDKPMTLDEMSEELGMSKMSMSNAIRELMEMGVAEKVFKKGIRKDLYVIEQDYYQFFINLFCANWRKAISKKISNRIKQKKELEDIIKDENSDLETKKRAERLSEEHEKAMEYFDWINRLILHFESHEIFEHVPKKKLQE